MTPQLDRATIELVPAAGGTELVAVHDLVDAATAEMYRAGRTSCFARLAAYLVTAGGSR